jgi:hypothetical protein
METRVLARHRAAAARSALVAAAALVLAGCAAGPAAPSAVERVDERTAVTVVTLRAPLLYSGAKGDLGQPLDLALGPVEINRMGERTWYLWVSLLGADLRDGDPRLVVVAAGERLVDLVPMPKEFAPPLSGAPYARPADWATERYYAIAASELARLHGRDELVVELAAPGGPPWRFEAWSGSARDLDAWLERQLQPQLAAR